MGGNDEETREKTKQLESEKGDIELWRRFIECGTLMSESRYFVFVFCFLFRRYSETLFAFYV
jgi:hypothetical protein